LNPNVESLIYLKIVMLKSEFPNGFLRQRLFFQQFEKSAMEMVQILLQASKYIDIIA